MLSNFLLQDISFLLSNLLFYAISHVSEIKRNQTFLFSNVNTKLIYDSYWSKFHVNNITGSGVMTIFFCKGLTRNLEIRNTPEWVLPNMWRVGCVRDKKFGKNVSNKMLLNFAKCQGYSFYRFWAIKGKQQEGDEGLNYPPPRLGLKEVTFNITTEFALIKNNIARCKNNLPYFHSYNQSQDVALL